MPRFNSMAARMAAALLGVSCLALYQLLHVMQHRLACHVSLQINGCTRGSSIAWHVMPRFVSITACDAASLGMSCLASNQWLCTWQQHRLAHHASLQLNGCTRGSSIAWHVMPRFVSVTACNAESLGMSCLASTQWLCTWQQHRLARYASLRLSTACDAASLGMSCLASNQW
jgi:hypothetical protein